MDGATLAEVMRQRGINMRYLGKVLDLVLRSPARDQLDHIFVSGAWPGRWWQLEAWDLPETSFFDSPRKSASESSSPAPPSTSSRHIYRCRPLPQLSGTSPGGMGPGEEPWVGA